jgi:hypothetical protein
MSQMYLQVNSKSQYLGGMHTDMQDKSRARCRNSAELNEHRLMV